MVTSCSFPKSSRTIKSVAYLWNNNLINIYAFDKRSAGTIRAVTPPNAGHKLWLGLTWATHIALAQEV